ncbi:hypothetical protein EYZ11_005394 [Aspergillus tanneri]|uniref:Uncharacterized protein n=1 Tax=Aspergillus tanneri TaxID=1220188 RepID=A0A4S3JIL6_9EURO|nr:hypothetical protein EYZ11_005394 [Aspergillus tanneri]
MYDISQVTIPWDNMDPECLQQPRKWNTPGVCIAILFGKQEADLAMKAPNTDIECPRVPTILAAIVGFVIPFVPALQGALHFARPAGSFVGFLAAELLIYCIQQQIVKMLYIWLFKVWL